MVLNISYQIQDQIYQKKHGLGFDKKCSISNHMYQRAKGWHHINDKLFNLRQVLF